MNYSNFFITTLITTLIGLSTTYTPVTFSMQPNWGPESLGTFLYLACKTDQTDVAKLFVSAGANVNAANRQGSSSLDYACKNGNIEIATLLVTRGAYLEGKDGQEWTPLHIACEHGSLEIAKFLIEHGAYVDGQKGQQWTPLHFACQNGHLEIAKLLIEKKANMEARDTIGWTPLHIASNEANPKLVKLLLDNGADLTAKTTDGKTACDIARKQNNQELAHFMQALCNKTQDIYLFVEDICSICMSNFENDEICMQLGCGHVYHYGCIKLWEEENPTCPLDRKPTVSKKIVIFKKPDVQKPEVQRPEVIETKYQCTIF